MVNRPSITIAVCTWNRAELLRGCLQAMLEQRVDPGIRWSVLVVDNNSDDQTQAVLSEFDGRLPLRSVVERKQGLSHARNRAVGEADSDYILWTDDDVRVPADWVQSFADAIVAFEWPLVLGGDVVPDFGANPPQWLLHGWRRVANAYAVRESPGHGERIRDGYLPFGANYATRTDKQRLHPYNPDLGRKGSAMLSGEEEAVISALLSEDGAFGVWLGNARVVHKIEPFRQRLSYLRSYFAGHGEVDRRRLVAQEPRSTGVPRWIYRALFSEYLRYWRKRYLERDDGWLEAYTKFAFTLGELRAWRRAR